MSLDLKHSAVNPAYELEATEDHRVIITVWPDVESGNPTRDAKCWQLEIFRANSDFETRGLVNDFRRTLEETYADDAEVTAIALAKVYAGSHNIMLRKNVWRPCQ